MEKIYCRWKSIVGENSSSEKIVCQGKTLLGKTFVGEKIRHLTKILSLSVKSDYDQIFDTTMFIKSLRFVLITRAFSKLL